MLFATPLLCSPTIARDLRWKGSMAVERLMGMLVMVAVEMLLCGVEHDLKH